MNNSDFGGEEPFVFFSSVIFGLVGAQRWYGQLRRIPPLGKHGAPHVALAATPIVALVGLLVVIMLGADPVRVAGQPEYVVLFLTIGLVWLWVCAYAASTMGVSVRDDALERHNPAAAWTVCGALLGGEAAYALSNVGSGATIWTTLLPAVIAFAVWWALWLVVELLSRPGEAISLDRDEATGVRHGLFLVASGLVLGRAMVGDWVSWSATLADFTRLGWPALVLGAAAVAVNRRLRPQPSRPQPPVLDAGILAGGGFLLAAIVILWLEGRS